MIKKTKKKFTFSKITKKVFKSTIYHAYLNKNNKKSFAKHLTG